MEWVSCELKYSRAAATFVVVAALATAAIVVVLPWDVALRAALVAFVAADAGLALERLAAVRALYVHLRGEVRVESRCGSAREGELAAGGFVAPWLVCLRWRPRRGRFDRVVLVLPDMLDADTFRRLRIVLRAA